MQNLFKKKNEVLLYSTGNYIQYSVVNHNGKKYEKEYIHIHTHIYIYLSHFAVHQKLTQHTSIKNNNKKKINKNR